MHSIGLSIAIFTLAFVASSGVIGDGTINSLCINTGLLRQRKIIRVYQFITRIATNIEFDFDCDHCILIVRVC